MVLRIIKLCNSIKIEAIEWLNLLRSQRPLEVAFIVSEVLLDVVRCSVETVAAGMCSADFHKQLCNTDQFVSVELAER